MVIVLQGPDTFRSSRRVRQLRAAFQEKFDPSGIATQTLDGTVLTSEQLLSALGSGGLFSTRRMVIIDDLTPSSPLWAASAVMPALTSVAADQERIVIFRFVPMTGQKKGRPAKEKIPTIPGAKEEPFPKLTDAALRTWLVKSLKERKGTITREAEEALLSRTGQDLWRLDQELEKLLAAGTGAITIDLVKTFLAGDVASDIFALTDALGQGDRARALRLLHQEFSVGTHPLVIVAALARHLQTLWRVRRALDLGQQPSPQDLDLHPFVIKKAISQVRTHTVDELHQWHHALLLVERDMKTSPLDAETLLDRCLMRGQS